MKAFETIYCSGSIVDVDGDARDIRVMGRIQEPVKDNRIYYIAAAPPDYRATFTGSGLPFASQQQAFENTPNTGSAELTIDNRFDIALMFPNSYYVSLGSVIVPPTLFLEYTTTDGQKRHLSIKISDGIPYRMLTYPAQFTRARQDPSFYAGGWQMPVRTQEQILRDAAYPATNKMAPNFWGLKPPN